MLLLALCRTRGRSAATHKNKDEVENYEEILNCFLPPATKLKPQVNERSEAIAQNGSEIYDWNSVCAKEKSG